MASATARATSDACDNPAALRRPHMACSVAVARGSAPRPGRRRGRWRLRGSPGGRRLRRGRLRSGGETRIEQHQHRQFAGRASTCLIDVARSLVPCPHRADAVDGSVDVDLWAVDLSSLPPSRADDRRHRRPRFFNRHPLVCVHATTKRSATHQGCGVDVATDDGADATIASEIAAALTARQCRRRRRVRPFDVVTGLQQFQLGSGLDDEAGLDGVNEAQSTHDEVGVVSDVAGAPQGLGVAKSVARRQRRQRRQRRFRRLPKQQKRTRPATTTSIAAE